MISTRFIVALLIARLTGISPFTPLTAPERCSWRCINSFVDEGQSLITAVDDGRTSEHKFLQQWTSARSTCELARGLTYEEALHHINDFHAFSYSSSDCHGPYLVSHAVGEVLSKSTLVADRAVKASGKIYARFSWVTVTYFIVLRKRIEFFCASRPFTASCLLFSFLSLLSFRWFRRCVRFLIGLATGVVCCCCRRRRAEKIVIKLAVPLEVGVPTLRAGSMMYRYHPDLPAVKLEPDKVVVENGVSRMEYRVIPAVVPTNTVECAQPGSCLRRSLKTRDGVFQWVVGDPDAIKRGDFTAVEVLTSGGKFKTEKGLVALVNAHVFKVLPSDWASPENVAKYHLRVATKRGVLYIPFKHMLGGKKLDSVVNMGTKSWYLWTLSDIIGIEFPVWAQFPGKPLTLHGTKALATQATMQTIREDVVFEAGGNIIYDDNLHSKRGISQHCIFTECGDSGSVLFGPRDEVQGFHLGCVNKRNFFITRAGMQRRMEELGYGLKPDYKRILVSLGSVLENVIGLEANAIIYPDSEDSHSVDASWRTNMSDFDDLESRGTVTDDQDDESDDDDDDDDDYTEQTKQEHRAGRGAKLDMTDAEDREGNVAIGFVNRDRVKQQDATAQREGELFVSNTSTVRPGRRARRTNREGQARESGPSSASAGIQPTPAESMKALNYANWKSPKGDKNWADTDSESKECSGLQPILEPAHEQRDLEFDEPVKLVLTPDKRAEMMARLRSTWSADGLHARYRGLEGDFYTNWDGTIVEFFPDEYTAAQRYFTPSWMTGKLLGVVTSDHYIDPATRPRMRFGNWVFQDQHDPYDDTALDPFPHLTLVKKVRQTVLEGHGYRTFFGDPELQSGRAWYDYVPTPKLDGKPCFADPGGSRRTTDHEPAWQQKEIPQIRDVDMHPEFDRLPEVTSGYWGVSDERPVQPTFETRSEMKHDPWPAFVPQPPLRVRQPPTAFVAYATQLMESRVQNVGRVNPLPPPIAPFNWMFKGLQAREVKGLTPPPTAVRARIRRPRTPPIPLDAVPEVPSVAGRGKGVGVARLGTPARIAREKTGSFSSGSGCEACDETPHCLVPDDVPPPLLDDSDDEDDPVIIEVMAAGSAKLEADAETARADTHKRLQQHLIEEAIRVVEQKVVHERFETYVRTMFSHADKKKHRFSDKLKANRPRAEREDPDGEVDYDRLSDILQRGTHDPVVLLELQTIRGRNRLLNDDGQNPFKPIVQYIQAARVVREKVDDIYSRDRELLTGVGKCLSAPRGGKTKPKPGCTAEREAELGEKHNLKFSDWVQPPAARDFKGIIDSLTFQLTKKYDSATQNRDEPFVDVDEQLLEEAFQSWVPCETDLFNFDANDEGAPPVLFALSNIIKDLNGPKSPGYSGCVKPGTKQVWIDDLTTTTTLVYLRLALISAYDRFDLSELTADEMFERGLLDPRTIFIKDEPHKLAKALQGRWRLIWPLSVLDEVVFAFFHKCQNKLDIKAYQNRALPGPVYPCIGVGHSDDGLNTFLYYAARVDNKEGTEADDASGFDISISFWQWYLDARRRTHCFARGFDAERPDYARKVSWFSDLTANIAILSAHHLVLVGNKIYRVEGLGIMPSAHPSTGASNTCMRLIPLYLSHKLPCLGVGDDAIKRGRLTEHGKRDIQRFGLDLRDVVYSMPGVYNFNSMKLQKSGGRFVVEFQNFEKLATRLVRHHGEFDALNEACVSAAAGNLFAIRHDEEASMRFRALLSDLGYPSVQASQQDADEPDE